MLPHFIFGMNFYSACIHHRERISAPLRVGVNSVAGDAGHVFDYAYAFSCETIKERAFAYVRSAYYRY